MVSENSVGTYWTTPRLELQTWFQKNAPSLGQLYEGALKMLFDGKIPGWKYFVAHAAREIRNRLPDVIAGRNSGGTVQYVGRMDDITENWGKSGFALDGSLPPSVSDRQEMPSANVTMPRRLFLKVATLIKDHVKARERPLDAAKRLFSAISPENQQLRDNIHPTIQQWLEVSEWFVKKVHLSGAQDTGCDEEELLRHFELFEITMGALIRGFFKTVEGLDEILEDTNS